MNDNYENYLIREMDPGEYEPLELDQTESFTQWLDAQGDALALPTSFTEWLNQYDDAL